VRDHDVKDYDPRVNEMLDRQVPLRLDAQADWAEALRRAEGATESDRNHSGRLAEWVAVRMRGRRLLAFAFGIAVLVVAGAATATGGWWNGWTPSAIDTTKATKLVEYKLIARAGFHRLGDTIALWRMPQPNGSVCFVTALASPKPTAPGTDGPNPANGSGSCGMSGSDERQDGKPIRVIGLSGGAGRYGGGWVIRGTVRSDSGITRLEIRSADGRLPLGYDNGWFLGQLPLSDYTNDLPKGGPYVVVGYDSKGKAIERLDLRQAFALPKRATS